MSDYFARGIDVSRYQGAIDWPAVASAGIRFAAVRATIGAIYKDPRAFHNVAGALAAGLLVTVYHVVRYDVPAQDQAENLLSMIRDMDTLSLPVVLDIELPTPAGQTTAHKTALQRTRELMPLLHAKTGSFPLIYTGAWWWNPATAGSEIRWALQSDLWVASYTPQPRLPSAPWSAWTFCQYTNKGSIPGISGYVDLDYYNGPLQELELYATNCTGYRPALPQPTVHTITVTGYNVAIQVA